MIKYIILILFIILFVVIMNLNGYILLSGVNFIISKIDNPKPFSETDKWWCQDMRDNYREIRSEFLKYIKKNKLVRFRDIDPNQRGTDTSKIPWHIIILRVYGRDTDKIKSFPITYELISKIPGCTLAMFSVLQAGKILEPHYGPYKGVLRYHLALIVPKKRKRCYLNVNGERYNWKKGKDVLFDDTFIHEVKNDTDEMRVVLFLDIKKEFKSRFLNWLNTVVLTCGKFNSTVDTIVKNVNNT